MFNSDDHATFVHLLVRVFHSAKDIRDVAEEVLGDVGGLTFTDDARATWTELLASVQTRLDVPRVLRGLCEAALRREPDGESAVLLEKLDPRPYLQKDFEWDASRSPFRGLRPYEVHHAGVFFGREPQVQEVLRCLHDTGRVMISGEAGTGKSSLAMAGVLAQLKGPATPLPGRRVFLPLLFKPGPTPWAELAATLRAARRGGLATEDPQWAIRVDALLDDARFGRAPSALWDLLQELGSGPVGVALLIDQMEELLTYGASTEGREALLGVLAWTFAQGPDPHVRLLATIRSDALPQLQGVPGWRAAGLELNEVVYPLRPPDAHALEEILRGAAKRCGVDLDESLVRAITRDAGQTVVSLPLVSFVLDTLWKGIERHQMRLTHAAYVDAGRIRGALDKVVSQFWDALHDDERRDCERLLLFLVDATPDGPARPRRALRSELFEAVAVGHGRLDALLARMVENRLLSVTAGGGEFVELAHDALLRNWRGFDALVARSRQALEVHTALREAVAHQLRPGQRGHLWSGPSTRRAEAFALAHQGKIDLTTAERAFLRSSRRRFVAYVAAAVGVVAVAACVAGALVSATHTADRERGSAVRSMEDARQRAREARTEQARAERAEASLDDFIHEAASEGFLRPSEHSKQRTWGELFNTLRSIAPDAPARAAENTRVRDWRRGRTGLSVAVLHAMANDVALLERAVTIATQARSNFEAAARAPTVAGDDYSDCALQIAIARCDAAIGVIRHRQGALDEAIRRLRDATERLDRLGVQGCASHATDETRRSWQVRVRSDLGNALADSGDFTHAAETFAAARAGRGVGASGKLDLRLAVAHWNLGRASESHLRAAAIVQQGPPPERARPAPRCLGEATPPLGGIRSYAEQLLRETDLPPRLTTHLHLAWRAAPSGARTDAGSCGVNLHGPLTPGLCFPLCRVDVACPPALAAYDRDYACVECAIDRDRRTIVGRDPAPYADDGDGTLEVDTANRCLVLSRPDGDEPLRFTLRPAAPVR